MSNYYKWQRSHQVKRVMKYRVHKRFGHWWVRTPTNEELQYSSYESAAKDCRMFVKQRQEEHQLMRDSGIF